VVAFDNGQEALAAFTAYPDSIDLVVTDETMPGLRGFDMSRQMLTLRPQLPIILCSGYSAHVTPEIAQRAGIRRSWPSRSRSIPWLSPSIMPSHPKQPPSPSAGAPADGNC